MGKIFSTFSRISGNLIDAAHFGVRFPLRHVTAAFGRSLEVNISPYGTLVLRPGSSDAATVRQVFRHKEYSMLNLPQWAGVLADYEMLISKEVTPLIIDAGANIGAASIWFSQLFPEATVIAIEPDSENAQACRTNIMQRPHIQLIEAAIGSLPGQVSLSNPQQQAWAVQATRSKASSDTVKICTISNLTSIHPSSALFMVKIDIEGFELDLFDANIDWIDKSKVIIIEPHDWMPGKQGSSRSFQSAMGPRDFDLLISGENLIYVNRKSISELI